MVNAYKKYWLNYVNFTGKSSRADYWWVILDNDLIMVAIYVLMTAVPFVVGLWIPFLLVTFIPSLALMARRYRDVGISPWWVILGVLIPIVNVIICIFPTKIDNSINQI